MSTWMPLIVVSAVALLSAALGLVLYRYSSAVIEKQAMRITGATAIAWVFFIIISRFYITVSQDMREHTAEQCEGERTVVLDTRDQALAEARSYKECVMITGDFKCKGPANRMALACERLANALQ